MSGQAARLGFTLAEVLITLGIIGVVAALTIPTLMANYQRKVWVTQLKKDVSLLQNSYRKVMADEGVDSIFDTSVAYKKSKNPYLFGYYPDKYAAYFGYTLSPASSLKNSLLNQVQGDILILPNGSCFYLAPETTSYGSEGLQLQTIIDVNCDKGPNVAGRDTFIIQLDGDAKLKFYGLGSFENSDVWRQLCTSETIDNYGKGQQDLFTVQMLATMCAGLIISDGWQMNY